MSFEMNKILGAVLGTLLFAMGLNIFSEILFTPTKPAVPGYDLPAAAEGEGAAGGEAKQEAEQPLPILLAKADAGRGEKAVGACKACHNFEKGAANKIGPALYGVVGRPVASHEGFNYSEALKGKGGNWDFDHINQFITNPKKYAPGTLMNFQGVAKAETRADILAYLATLHEPPVPLPKADAAAAPAAAPASAAAPAPAANTPAKAPAGAAPTAKPEAPAATPATPPTATPAAPPKAEMPGQAK
jgi:cytochrome c